MTDLLELVKKLTDFFGVDLLGSVKQKFDQPFGGSLVSQID